MSSRDLDGDSDMPLDPARARPPREPSPAAREVSEWLHQLGRLLRMTRTFGLKAPHVRQLHEQVVRDLALLGEHHAPFTLQVAPLELRLGDEVVQQVQRGAAGETGHGWERETPFLLYRDGVRGLALQPGLGHDEAAALVGVLVTCAGASLAHDDAVTLLWEAELPHVRVDAAPLEQAIEVAAPAKAAGVERAVAEAAIAAAPDQTWLERDPLAGAFAGAGGPGRGGTGGAVHFDDWPGLSRPASPAAELWRELHLAEPQARTTFVDEWRRDAGAEFASGVRAFVSQVSELDPGEEMRAALAAAVVTWLAGAVQRCDWDEALRAHEVLHPLDPRRTLSDEPLALALGALDAEAIALRLDESEPAEQARFFALAVRMGPPALDLSVAVLARAGRSRLRAAATTALAYACADEPQRLGRYLGDARWQVVRNVVFVLGQIGGEAVAPMLATAARHVDTRVRRAAVSALGQVPAALRLPLLLAQLDTTDGQLLTATLSLLVRERDPQIAKALLERAQAPDFEARSDDYKLAVFGALADVADDAAVPALEALLVRGGWFARRSAERSAAARTLARLRTPRAQAALAAGLRHRSEAVRAACLEALNVKEHA
ncbi:MAG TPA: HEAT repeat domain-containing protein [Candidatus Eisenbacteria bacterium]|nr:HEAT repeat domain-containing protein [Candidatus Eisenbacteria bacterium]